MRFIVYSEQSQWAVSFIALNVCIFQSRWVVSFIAFASLQVSVSVGSESYCDYQLAVFSLGGQLVLLRLLVCSFQSMWAVSFIALTSLQFSVAVRSELYCTY